MTRKLTGVLLLRHGLAHAGPGMWAAGRGPDWLVTPLWMGAMLGFLAAGFGVLGASLLRRWWRPLAVVGAAGSLLLLGVLWHLASVVGVAMNAAVLGFALTRRETHHSPVLGGRRAWAGTTLAFVALAYVAVLLATRPWHMSWGATAEEQRMPLSGDELVADARYRMDHVVTITAPADSVWQWLVQIGQDRAGFYSYAWLENLVGARIRNADTVVPEWQERSTGDFVRAVPADWLGGRFGPEIGWRVAHLEPGRALVLENWGAFVVRPVDPGTTRLHARLRGEGRPTLGGVIAPAGLMIFEPVHFIMERGMLLGIKRRAERPPVPMVDPPELWRAP